MQIPVIRSYAWVLVAVMAMSAFAAAPDGAIERQRLAGIERELQRLERLSFEAEAMADREAPPRFNYPVLRRHLALMRTAVQDHLLAAGAQPRVLPASDVAPVDGR